MKQMSLRFRFVVFVAVVTLMSLCLSFLVAMQNNNYLFLLAGGVILVVVVLASIFFSGKIIGPMIQTVSELYEGAEHSLLAATRLTESSFSVAQGSTTQAAAVEETSSSLEEMAAMTQQNAENIREADTKMRESEVYAKKSLVFMGELKDSMREISMASEETSKIIKTIDEIAFQTNLLALNAAVEAARAGEAGAGFAVVADEVRNLAMRAAEAAKTTSQMLEDTLGKVEKGVELVSKTSTTFDNMTKGGAQVAQLLVEIAASSSEQATGIEQINKAVSEIDKVIQTNAAGSEENVGASREMSEWAEKMKQYVAMLAAIVSGSEAMIDMQTDASAVATAPRHSGQAATKENPLSKTRQGPRPAKTREISPEKILPLDSDDFEDF